MVASSSSISPVRKEKKKAGIELCFSMITRRPIFVCRQKRVAPVRSGSRRYTNNLDHLGSLHANNLVTLVLDCERVNRKKSGSHCCPEGERIGTLRCSITKREQPRPDPSGSGQAWLLVQAKGSHKLEQAMALEHWLSQSTAPSLRASTYSPVPNSIIYFGSGVLGLGISRVFFELERCIGTVAVRPGI